MFTQKQHLAFIENALNQKANMYIQTCNSDKMRDVAFDILFFKSNTKVRVDEWNSRGIYCIFSKEYTENKELIYQPQYTNIDLSKSVFNFITKQLKEDNLTIEKVQIIAD